MTLVVSKIYDGLVSVVADTQLTLPNEILPTRRNFVDNNIIKSIIIRRHICVSFSGNISFAKDAISQIYKTDSIEKIRELLFNSHNCSNNQVDYILAISDGDPQIFLYKDKKEAQYDTAWIGSNAAYSLYQEKYHSNTTVNDPLTGTHIDVMHLPDRLLEDNYAEFSRIYSSFSSIIEANRCDDIGGFITHVFGDGDGFKYMSYAKSFRRPLSNDESVPGEWSTVKWLGAEDGSYSVNLAGSEGNVVAIHVRQGKFGVIFLTDEGGMLSPNLERDVDEIDFNDRIKARYDIQLSILLEGTREHFAAKAEKCLKEGGYKRAAELFEVAMEKGIAGLKGKESKKAYKSILEANKENPKIEYEESDAGFFVQVLKHKANAHSRIGEWNEALNACNEILGMENEQFEAHKFAAVSLFQLNRYEEALERINTYIELSGENANNMLMKAELNFILCNLNEAKSNFDRVLELDPENKISKEYIEDNNFE